MKIDLLKLIEDALIGGRYGEMVYVYNNPLIQEIYLESSLDFREFLQKSLSETKEVSSKEVELKFELQSYETEEFIKEDTYRSFKKSLDEYQNFEKVLENEAKKVCKELRDNPFVGKILTYIDNGDKVRYNIKTNTFYGKFNKSKIIKGTEKC